MHEELVIRSIQRTDVAEWRPLWDGYNAFYGRIGETALPENITSATWERFFDPAEPMQAFVAQHGSKIVGLVHFLYHRSTSRLNDVCYMQDLFTIEHMRGKGIGRKLILAVYEAAALAGCSRVYWQTQLSNEKGRALYDKIGEHKGFIVYTHEL